MESKREILIVEAACPLCGATKPIRVLDELEDVEDRTPGRYSIGQCAGCGLIYLSRRPTEDSLPLCYPTHYHVIDVVRRNPIPEFLYALRLRSRHRRVAHALRSKCRALLEIGCGDGSFLALLDRIMPPDCTLTGIDLLVPATESRASSRLTLIQGEFEKWRFPDKYDAVVMFNVLEHLANPAISLRRIAGLLRPEGVLFGEVPNWDSAWRKVFPRHWQGLQIPRHQTHFERTTLRQLLDAAGYDVINIRPIYDPGDLSVSLCNWIVDRLRLKTPPRRVWFYFPTVVLAAPVVWLVNLITRNSGSIEFTATRRSHGIGAGSS